MKRLTLLTIMCAVVALGFIALDPEKETFGFESGKVQHQSWLYQHNSLGTPKADTRLADQTFLTFPEWFLVHSPAEQAEYFKLHTSTTFPFGVHIAQFWESYGIVSQAIAETFEYNAGYHFMINVIGVSTTIEYAIKAVYENTLGAFTYALADQAYTEEDQFNQKYMQDYVDFIRATPWYEFDYFSRISVLWSQTSFFGEHFIRKLERKYMLTTELVTKGIYAQLIKLGTQSIYDFALLTTVVVVGGVPKNLDIEGAEVLETTAEGYLLVRAPRYEAFMQFAWDIEQKGGQFVEIAGNQSALLLSVIVPVQKQLKSNKIEVLFEQHIPTDVAYKRVVLMIQVENLTEILSIIKRQRFQLEHIYDY